MRRHLYSVLLLASMFVGALPLAAQAKPLGEPGKLRSALSKLTKKTATPAAGQVAPGQAKMLNPQPLPPRLAKRIKR
jgi:hypothetical protein